MTIGWQPVNDLVEVVDGVEEVTVYRRSSRESLAVKAWRSGEYADEPEPSDGHLIRRDTVWVLSIPAGEPTPKLGDRIVDSDNQCWTILKTQQRRLGLPLRCETRSLFVGSPLEGRVTIREAVWSDSGSGPEVVAWRPIRTITARLQPKSVEVDSSSAAQISTSHYRLLLLEDFDLNHNHQIVDHHGLAYRVDRYSGAQQLGAHAVAEVTLVDP